MPPKYRELLHRFIDADSQKGMEITSADTTGDAKRVILGVFGRGLLAFRQFKPNGGLIYRNCCDGHGWCDSPTNGGSGFFDDALRRVGTKWDHRPEPCRVFVKLTAQGFDAYNEESADAERPTIPIQAITGKNSSGLDVQFRELGDTFDKLPAMNGDDAGALAITIKDYAIKAGHMLIQARRRGAFANDRWWSGCGDALINGIVDASLKSGATRMPGIKDGKANGGWAYCSDDGRALHAWHIAVGSWLGEMPGELPKNAGSEDWFHFESVPWTKAEKSKLAEWDKEVARIKKLPGPHKYPPLPVRGKSRRIEDRLTKSQWLGRHRRRAAVYALACRAIARLIGATTNYADRTSDVVSESPGAAGESAQLRPGNGSKTDLRDRHYETLTAMKKLGATSKAKRRTAATIAEKRIGERDAYRVKIELAELAGWGLVGSLVGRGGGSWLTPAGRKESSNAKKR